LFVVSRNGYVFRSIDYGNSWTELNTKSLYGSIIDITECGELLYAVTSVSGCCVSFSSQMYKSSDNGYNWSEIKPTLFIYPLCLTVIGKSIYLGTLYDGVFKSNDNGETWSALNSGLQEMKIKSLSVFGSNMYS